MIYYFMHLSMKASQTEVPLSTFVTSYLVLQVEKSVVNIHLCYIKPLFPLCSEHGRRGIHGCHQRCI